MNKKSVLILEDNRELLNLYKDAFESIPVDLSLLDSGDKALILVKCESFDLIILDIAMKYPNGLEVLKNIREKSKDQKVIICSAFSEVAFDEFRYETFVKKPVKIKILLDKVKEKLEIN